MSCNKEVHPRLAEIPVPDESQEVIDNTHEWPLLIDVIFAMHPSSAECKEDPTNVQVGDSPKIDSFLGPIKCRDFC